MALDLPHLTTIGPARLRPRAPRGRPGALIASGLGVVPQRTALARPVAAAEPLPRSKAPKARAERAAFHAAAPRHVSRVLRRL